MTGSPYSYYSRDPGPHIYDIGDSGPQYHMDMGTRGPQNGGSPFSHDTGSNLLHKAQVTSLRTGSSETGRYKR